MKPNGTTLLNPTQATTDRNGTPTPNPQELERQRSAQETPAQPPAEVIEQKREADSAAWTEFLTQGPVNFSRANEQVDSPQPATPAEDEEKRAAVLETLRIINERPLSPEVAEQQAAVIEAERIITEHQIDAVVEQSVEPNPVQHLESGGLIIRVKEGVVDLIKHINFKVFFTEFKDAMGDLWRKIWPKKENPAPQPDPEKQAEMVAGQITQQARVHSEQAHQRSRYEDIFKTTRVHEVENLTQEERARLGGYRLTSENLNSAYGIAVEARAKKSQEEKAQQPQGLPEVSTKRKPGLITAEQATNIELIGGSGRVSGPTNKG